MKNRWISPRIIALVEGTRDGESGSPLIPEAPTVAS